MKKIVIANFKSNKTREEYEHWADEFEKKSLPQNVQVILAPPTVDLMFFANRFTNTEHALAVQDISPFPAGAYTGAISALNLEGFGVRYAIVGHSERRRYFHETIQDVANKAREALTAKIIPIVCVRKEDINGQANALDEDVRKKVIVAFEPVDHIGTGAADTLENILETKKMVKTAFGDVPYIYGGSVDATTDPALLKSSEIDGFLVGSASLSVERFYSLLQLV
jgi:triosephosphate isomerase (TIM)